MYGYDYRKTTRIWTNNTAFQSKLCSNGSCGKTVIRRGYYIKMSFIFFFVRVKAGDVLKNHAVG